MPSLAPASVGNIEDDTRPLSVPIGSSPGAWRFEGDGPDAVAPEDEAEGEAIEGGQAESGRPGADGALAITELRREADDGDAEAQYELATAYAVGGGVPRDPAAAAEWMERAALQGFPPAVADLGVMYLHSDGVPRDQVKACALLTAAVGLAVPAEIRPEVACGALSADDRQAAKRITANRGLWRRS
ncbi:tetratricopeptide repeat protein [Azospirillum sp. sgz301742]